MKVLIVDDDNIVLAMLSRTLENAGYEVIEAGSGANGVRAWKRERPPIVITDWIMPGMDGKEFCTYMRQERRPRYTYIIMLTGKEGRSSVVEGLEAGADDYVKKPFDKAELLLRVRAGVRVVQLENGLFDRIAELQDALDQVRTLEGLLPMCSYCKRIQTEHGDWLDTETYISQCTPVSFTHGFCPECYEKHVRPQLPEGGRPAQPDESPERQ